MKCHGVHLLDAVYLLVPPAYSQYVVAVGHEYVHRFPLYAETATTQFYIVADVECVNEAAQKLVAVQRLSLLYLDDVLLQGHRSPHAVNARDGRHYHHIPAPREQGRDSPQAQLVYLLVDGKVFFYVGVGGGQIRLRLVIVVVRNIVFHGVLGEEALHLLVELGGKRLVVAQHKGRFPRVGNDVCHGEGLARPGNAQQNLCFIAVLDALREAGYGLRLVAGRLVFGCQFEIHERKSTKNAPIFVIKTKLIAKKYFFPLQIGKI